MKKETQFKRYIPVTILNKIEKLEYPRKDDLYTIIDLIHRKEIYYKSDYQNRYGFTEISRNQFTQLITSPNNVLNAINFLVDNGLLLKNDYHVIGIKSKSYKIPKELQGRTIPVTLNDKNINKKIFEQINKIKKEKVKNLDFVKSRYYKTFKINYTQAENAILEKTIKEIKLIALGLNINFSEQDILDIIYCNEGHQKKRMMIILNKEASKELDNILHRYMIYITRINAINDGFLFFKRNETNGRLDTNLTSLPSFLRPFLIADEQLMNIDIKNSQPYFLYTVLKNESSINKDELNKYGELVLNGNLYEYMLDEFYKTTGYRRTRIQMKKMIYKIFFSKVTSFPSQKDFFGKMFPTIMKFINEINTKNNSTLAIMLQSKESFAVLDVIIPLLEKENIRPFTIHDSFVCGENEALIIKNTIENKFIEMFGLAPSLHLDYILPSVANEDEIAVWDDEFLEEIANQYDLSDLTIYINPEIINKPFIEFTRVNKKSVHFLNYESLGQHSNN